MKRANFIERVKSHLDRMEMDEKAMQPVTITLPSVLWGALDLRLSGEQESGWARLMIEAAHREIVE